MQFTCSPAKSASSAPWKFSQVVVSCFHIAPVTLNVVIKKPVFFPMLNLESMTIPYHCQCLNIHVRWSNYSENVKRFNFSPVCSALFPGVGVDVFVYLAFCSSLTSGYFYVCGEIQTQFSLKATRPRLPSQLEFRRFKHLWESRLALRESSTISNIGPGLNSTSPTTQTLICFY